LTTQEPHNVAPWSRIPLPELCCVGVSVNVIHAGGLGDSEDRLDSECTPRDEDAEDEGGFGVGDGDGEVYFKEGVEERARSDVWLLTCEGRGTGKLMEDHQSNSCILDSSIPADSSRILTPSGTKNITGRSGADRESRVTRASRWRWS